MVILSLWCDEMLCPDFDNNANNISAEKSKIKTKKFTKKKTIILSAVSLFLVATILVVSLNFTAVAGFFIKNFCSDATYMMFVEKVSFDTYSKDFITAIDNYRDVFKPDFCKDINIKMQASDEIISVAESYTEPKFGLSLDWLNDIIVDGVVNIKNNKGQADLALYLKDKEITDLSYIRFFETGDQYLNIPCLTDEYLHSTVEPQKLKNASKLFNDPQIKELIPSEKQRKRMIAKYIMIIIKEFDDVKGYDKEVTLNNHTETLRVLEFTLDSDTANTIKKNILTELKKDKKIKKVIEDFDPVLKEKGIIKNDEVLYDNFIAMIDKELLQVEKYLANPVNKEIFTLVDYVDKHHQIVGRDLIIDKNKVFSSLYLGDDFTFATDIKVLEHTYKTNSKGTIKNDVVYGQMNVTVDDKNYATLTLSELDLEDAKNGSFKGKLNIDLTKAILSKLTIEEDLKTQLLGDKPNVELNFEVSTETVALDIAVNDSQKELFCFEIDTKNSEAFDIKKPDDKRITDNKDEFFNSFDKLELGKRVLKSGFLFNISDFDVFVKSLEEVGVSPVLCKVLLSITKYLP